MQRYRLDSMLGDGSFGSVYRAVDLRTGDTVAVKSLKSAFASWNECLHLREVASLTKLKHENIIRLKEVVYVKEDGRLFFVFEFADANLYSFAQARKALLAPGVSDPDSLTLRASLAKLASPLLFSGFCECEVRSIAGQLLRGLSHMHKHGFFHRDIKPENILIICDKAKRGAESTANLAATVGKDDFTTLTFKLCDFGQARETRSRPPYTGYVSTRWYRAPEVILGLDNYNSPIDIWAAACVMGELITGRPLFPGTSAINQLYVIAAAIGPPSAAEWTEGARAATTMGLRFGMEAEVQSVDEMLRSAGASEEAVAVITSMLQWDPSARPSAAEVLAMPFFRPYMLAVDERVARATPVPSNSQTTEQNRADGWSEHQRSDSPAVVAHFKASRSLSDATGVEKRSHSVPTPVEDKISADIDIDAELRSLNLDEKSPQKVIVKPASSRTTMHTSTSTNTSSTAAPVAAVIRDVSKMTKTQPTATSATTTTTAAAPVAAPTSSTTLDHEMRDLGLVSPPKGAHSTAAAVNTGISQPKKQPSPRSLTAGAPAGSTAKVDLNSSSSSSNNNGKSPGFFSSLFSGFRKSPKKGKHIVSNETGDDVPDGVVSHAAPDVTPVRLEAPVTTSSAATAAASAPESKQRDVFEKPTLHTKSAPVAPPRSDIASSSIKRSDAASNSIKKKPAADDPSVDDLLAEIGDL